MRVRDTFVMFPIKLIVDKHILWVSHCLQQPNESNRKRSKIGCHDECTRLASSQRP